MNLQRQRYPERLPSCRAIQDEYGFHSWRCDLCKLTYQVNTWQDALDGMQTHVERRHPKTHD